MGLAQPSMDERWKARAEAMTTIRLRSPAKINWTLDVLGRRDDGYHELRTVLQTIGLSDTVTVSTADEIEVLNAAQGNPEGRGLRDDDLIVIRGQTHVRDGDRVEVYDPERASVDSQAEPERAAAADKPADSNRASTATDQG